MGKKFFVFLFVTSLLSYQASALDTHMGGRTSPSSRTKKAPLQDLRELAKARKRKKNADKLTKIEAILGIPQSTCDPGKFSLYSDGLKTVDIQNLKRVVPVGNSLIGAEKRPSDKVRLAIKMAGVPKDRLSHVVEYAPKLFTEDMIAKDKVQIIQAVSCFPPKVIPHVVTHAPKLFPKTPDSEDISLILYRLKDLPEKSLLPVLVNAPKLLSPQVTFWDSFITVETLGKISYTRIADVTIQAPKLFSENMDIFQRCSLIKTLSTLPKPRLIAVIQLALIRGSEDIDPKEKIKRIHELSSSKLIQGLPEDWRWQEYLFMNNGLSNLFGRPGNEGKSKEEVLLLHFLKYGQGGGRKYKITPTHRPDGPPKEWTWQGYLKKNPGLANLFWRGVNKELLEFSWTNKEVDIIKREILLRHYLRWGRKLDY